MAIIEAHSHMNSGNWGGNCPRRISAVRRPTWRLSEIELAVISEVRFNNREKKTNKTSLFLPFSSPRLDPRPRWLSDGGVGRRLQSQGAEGGSARGDGAVGGHPHSPPRAGTQPQDLGFPQRAARVGSHFDSSLSNAIFFFFFIIRKPKAEVLQSVGSNRGVFIVVGFACFFLFFFASQYKL